MIDSTLKCFSQLVVALTTFEMQYKISRHICSNTDTLPTKTHTQALCVQVVYVKYGHPYNACYIIVFLVDDADDGGVMMLMMVM